MATNAGSPGMFNEQHAYTIPEPSEEDGAEGFVAHSPFVVPTCKECKVGFGYFKWTHTCKHCYQEVCADPACSEKDPSTGKRTCATCMKRLRRATKPTLVVQNGAGISPIEMEQRKHFSVLFSIGDIDGNGNIDKEELRTLIADPRFKHNVGSAEYVMLSADRDGDGQLDEPEFIAFMMSHIAEEQRKHFEKLFKIGDLDGDGSIDKEELQILLNDPRFKYDVGTVQDLLREADQDGDEMLDREEFVQYMMKHASQNREVTAEEKQKRHFEHLFAIGDRDGDGSIDKMELELLLNDTRFRYDVGSVTHVMKVADTDGDGIIDRQEFVTFMTNHVAAATIGRSSSAPLTTDGASNLSLAKSLSEPTLGQQKIEEMGQPLTPLLPPPMGSKATSQAPSRACCSFF